MFQLTPDIEKIAINTAKKSNQRKVKMAAIVISSHLNPKIVSTLHANNYNIFDNTKKRSIHAEEHLIIKAARMGVSLKGSTVLTYRYTKGIPGSSRPCNVCQEKLKKAGVGKIIYRHSNKWITERIVK
ncbi:MAG: hypothetical protein GF411_14765 [Candidatus Lokiarchaeota archaeon]|nr:hypothetical protein [Candidatus Lokiarchaeota archaeon]